MQHPTSRQSTLATQNTNGHCFEKERFATTGWQIWIIDEAVQTTMSLSESRQERLGGRKDPSHWSIAQLAIQKEACGGDTT